MIHLYIPNWLTGAVIAIVLSAGARALPEPLPMGSRFYLWAYRFAQNMLANSDKADKTDKLVKIDAAFDKAADKAANSDKG